MILYLLDTNIVSYGIKPQYVHLRKKLATELARQSIAISAITRAELRAGQALLQKNDKRILTIDVLLRDIPTLDWTHHAADEYGGISATLVKTGQSIGIADTQIAAHALSENLTLVTHNLRHFERVSKLKIQDWTEEKNAA